jgi:uncharacterized Zn finger protein (UPF0148 family)
MATATAPTVRDFRCNGCGSPLKIPSNSRGKVTCPSCKTDCVIDGLVKNAEMAEKENITGGVPLSASPSMLHRKLVSAIAETAGMPLDVFEKVEVLREEHHCVPAYYFYCNGTASYTYEAGNIRSQVVVRDTGDKSWEERRSHTEWTQMNGTANVSAEVVTSGNKAFGSQVNGLYKYQKTLFDFDELEFPHDVITHDFNFVQTASFNEYAKPYVERLLEANAEKAVESKTTRDLTMSGSRIDKDEVRRIFLGMYRVVFKYGDKEYTMWLTGDGEKIIHDGMPVDAAQKAAVDNKRQEMEREVSSVPIPSTTGWTIGKWVCIIAALFTYGISLIGAVVCHIKRKNVMNPYHEHIASVRSKYQSEITSLEAGAKNVVQQFRNKKKPLCGIYEQEVTGDSSAF